MKRWFVFLFILPWWPALAWSGVVDVSGFTQVDTQEAIDANTTTVTWTALTCDGDSYVYGDYSGDPISGDFTHQFEFLISDPNENINVAPYVLSNYINDIGGIDNYSPVVINWTLFGGGRLYVDIYDDGVQDVHSYVAAAVDTPYFVTVVRDIDGGQNSNILYTVTVRTGSHEGDLVGTITGGDADDLTQDSYDYFYPLNLKNVSNAGYYSSGWSRNYDLGTEEESTPLPVIQHQYRRRR